MNGCHRSIARSYRWFCLHWKPFLFPFKWRLLQATPDSLWNTHENSRGGDAVQETQPHFPSKSVPPQQEAAAQHCRPHTGPSVLHRSVCRLLPYWAANTHNQENPGKRRHDHMLHLRSFSSQLFWYFAVGSKQLALSPISSWLSCSWSWHPWFLRSQPWRCRTRKHLAGVSNLLALTTLPSRYSANWAMTCPCSFCVRRLPLVSVCKHFPSHPPTSSPAEVRSSLMRS